MRQYRPLQQMVMYPSAPHFLHRNVRIFITAEPVAELFPGKCGGRVLE